jgi:hypothetical protein
MYKTVKQYFLRPDNEAWGSALPNKTDHAHASVASGEVTEYDLVALQNSQGNEVNAACIARRKIASLVVEDTQAFRALQQELRSRRMFTHGAVASVLSEVLTGAGEELLTRRPIVRKANSRSSLIEDSSIASAPRVKVGRRGSIENMLGRISSGCGVRVASAGQTGGNTRDPLELLAVSITSARRRASSCIPRKQYAPDKSDTQEALMWKRMQNTRIAQQPSMKTAHALNMAWTCHEEDSQRSLSTADSQSSASKKYDRILEETESDGEESDEEAMLAFCSKMFSTDVTTPVAPEEDSQKPLFTAASQSSASEKYDRIPEEKESDAEESDEEAMLAYCSKMFSTDVTTPVASATECSNPVEEDDSDLLVDFPCADSQRQ